MFKKILSVVTFVLIAFVIWNSWDLITETIGCVFGGVCPEGGEFSINILIVLLLIPEQLFMYYSAGQIFFSYMNAQNQLEKRKFKRASQWELTRISFELNFVNHAIPSGGFSGLGYIAWRLHDYGATAGQVSFMYLLRYMITVCANQTQTIIAIIVLWVTGSIPEGALWMVGLIGLLSVGVILAVVAGIIIASNRKLIDWFSKISSKFLDWGIKTITFGRKTSSKLKYTTIHKFFLDLHEDFLLARKHKKILIKPILWGVLYNFLEIATYEIVALAMGHGEIFPQIMVAEALSSVIGAFLLTPGGVGGYEGAMIAVMVGLGTSLPVASTVVIVTRVIVLLNTIVSGYGFYQNAISKIGKKDREKILKMNEENKVPD